MKYDDSIMHYIKKSAKNLQNLTEKDLRDLRHVFKQASLESNMHSAEVIILNEYKEERKSNDQGDYNGRLQ